LKITEKVLGAFVKQIVRGLGAIPGMIVGEFGKAEGKTGGRGLRVPRVLSFLKASLASFERAFICIDTLDVLLKHQPTLLRSLHNISQSSPGVGF